MSVLDIPSLSLETVIRHGAAVQAMTLAGFAALIYDHLLTLDVEIDLIWRAKKGLVSFIFLLNRYIVPLVLIVDIYEMFALAIDSAMFCKVWTTLQSILTIASFMAIHTIIAFRVYALYNGQRWMGRFLWVVGIIYFASSTSIVALAHVHLIPDLEPKHHQCVGSIPSFLWAAWLPSVIFETILFGLTFFAMVGHDKRHSFNTLSIILYRDGMLYFVVVTLCSLFSMLVWAFADATLLGLARYFALAIVNIAGSRLVLNLKSYAAQTKSNPSDWETPISEFALGPQFLQVTPTPQDVEGGGVVGDSSPTSESSLIDLELYSVEREYQHIGSRIH
ncbi:hypothetical protein ABKN59_005504 [Abortiporus biennis]